MRLLTTALMQFLNRAGRLLAALLIGGILVPCFGCSVLSHEALIDAAWEANLKPLLSSRFPNATPQDMQAAHGYAYGGAIIQDLGYYPHGSKQFSNLTHYVRTGDFVLALLAEAHDVNELAFALGALSHYACDTDVHRDATNPGESILYPKLRKKFGPIVTYEEDPAAHLKTEFGFDVLEVARGNYAPEAYHAFVGFDVTEGLLGRAFLDTYGLKLGDLFPDTKRSIGSYRRAVSKTIPEATRVAWAEREHDIEQVQPGMTERRFVYVMTRSSYEREWGKQYDRPTAGDRIMAVLLKIVPPIGPLRALHFEMPTPDVEKLFMKSFERSLNEYRSDLASVCAKRLSLPNKNYDLGEVTGPGIYRLQDETYADWFKRLSRKQFQTVTPGIRAAIFSGYPGHGALDKAASAPIAVPATSPEGH